MIIEIKEGSKVYYTAPHGEKSNGIVKSLNKIRSEAFVVYHCNDDWDDYKHYTGALTPLEDLTPGWIEKEQNENQTTK